MKLRLIARQLIGVVLLPIAIVLLTLCWVGEVSERLYDIIRHGLNNMLGEP